MGNLSDESLLLEFVAESKEHLASIEPDLLALEQEGGKVDQEIINRVFRAIHNLKGAAGFFGLTAIKNLSHTMESVLMLVRDGKITPTPKVMDCLLVGVDKLNLMLADVHASDNVACQEEIQRLEEILGKTGGPSNRPVSLPDSELHSDPLSLETAVKRGKKIYSLKVRFDQDLAQKQRTPLDLLEQLMTVGEVFDSAFNAAEFPALDCCLDASLSMKVLCATVLEKDLLALTVDIPIAEIEQIEMQEFANEQKTETSAQTDMNNIALADETTEEAASKEDTTLKATKNQDQSGSGETKPSETKVKQSGSAGETAETIRVKVDLLNKLMDLAGEMVLSRNQLLRILGKEIYQHNGLATIVQNVDLITSDLQEHIMQTRMQPIGSIFGKFPRVIRDMAKQLGKEIELQSSGEDVELDKTILESLSDPLTHLIRNCCDHAIEMPEERVKAGKPRTGTVCLKAFHEGGQINISVTDDGRGIDYEKLVKKALANGSLTEAEAKRMSIQEKINLIFLPGLSTTDQVSEISGRGVGMDVVKTNIEKAGGHITLETTPGKGTTILLRLPLTLAIIPSLIVGVCGQRFAVPQVNLVELVCVKASEISTRIEKVGTAAVLRLRGKLLPLVRLADVLGLERVFFHEESGEYRPDRRVEIADPRSQAASDGSNGKANVSEEPPLQQRSHWSSDYNILVLKVGSYQFGLIVETLFDSEEIVVKPLSGFIKSCKCFAGATIMGDGRVAMILDAGGILSFSKLSFSEISAEERRREIEKADKDISRQQNQAVILFNNALDENFALPLDSVLRLEKIDPSRIEHVGQREFLTYEDRSLMLLHLSNYLSVRPCPDNLKEAFLIIPKAGDGDVGIMVSRILDTVETSIEKEKSLVKQAGVSGSIIVNDHLALVIEPQELLKQAGISTNGGSNGH